MYVAFILVSGLGPLCRSTPGSRPDQGDWAEGHLKFGVHEPGTVGRKFSPGMGATAAKNRFDKP